MKLICDGRDLYDAVLKVSKALGTKTANPVLEGIKISAFGDTLTLVATDTELTIVKKIKADVLMEGETVVVGKYFVDFVKKLEKEQVELSRLFDAQLQIKYSDSESELQVYPVENFPVIEKKENVSKVQCTIVYVNNNWVLYDGVYNNKKQKKSTNGLWLLATKPFELKEGSLLKSGVFRCTVKEIITEEDNNTIIDK